MRIKKNFPAPTMLCIAYSCKGNEFTVINFLVLHLLTKKHEIHKSLVHARNRITFYQDKLQHENYVVAIYKLLVHDKKRTHFSHRCIRVCVENNKSLFGWGAEIKSTNSKYVIRKNCFLWKSTKVWFDGDWKRSPRIVSV